MSPLHAGKRIALPRIVDRAVLERLAQQIAEDPATVEIRLDWKATLHLDYRALRRFAKRLWEFGAGTRPILLIGMSPYLRQIFRFALTGRDWDLFEEHRPQDEAWGEGGYLPPRYRLGSRDRIESRGPLRPFHPWIPSPN